MFVMWDLFFLMIAPGFIALILFGFILLWGVLSTWGLWLKPPLPRHVKILAITQLVTSLLYETLWIDLTSFCNPLSHLGPLFSNSVAKGIIIMSWCSCAIAFLTTMLVAMCKPNRSNIRCFFLMLFQSLFYFWTYIALDAPGHC